MATGAVLLTFRIYVETMEALNIHVLREPTRLDVNRVDLTFLGPAQHAVRGEIRPFAGRKTLRHPAFIDQPAVCWIAVNAYCLRITPSSTSPVPGSCLVTVYETQSIPSA